MIQNRSAISSNKIKILKIQIAIVILMFLPYYMSGQGCVENLKKSCPSPDDKEFKQFNISRAAFVEVNRANLCSVVFPPNKEYLIEFYSISKYKPVKIRLINKKSNQIIYDNRTDEYKESATFAVDDNPINILIEITVNTNKLNMDASEIERVCAGFTIFFKRRL
jgi:hypothetical protein